MKQKPSIVFMLLLSISLLGVSTAAFCDEENDGFFSRLFGWTKAPGVAAVTNQQYLDECGSCHFSYQPGLLPARSWTKLMAGLENHFNENAELPAEDAKKLTDYLVENAADHDDYKRSRRIMKSLNPDDTPLRVSKTPYFISKHGELSKNMVEDNPQVRSLSKCSACHTRATEGFFSESEIDIPRFGAWED